MTHTTPRSWKIKLIGGGLGLTLTLGLGLFLSEYSAWIDPFPNEIVPTAASPLTPAPQQEEAPPGGVEITHVRVGQTYHFQGLQPGVTTVWKVKEITPTEIRYEEGQVVEGRYVSRGTFLFPRRDVQASSGLVKMGQERVYIGGAEFDCEVYEAQGVKSWSAAKFPGTIRTVSGDKVVRALVRIEPSKA